MSFSYRSQSFMDVEKKTVWSKKVIIATVLLLGSGTMSTVSFAYISSNLGFKHGFLQTLQMFLGELQNQFIYWVMISPRKSRYQHYKELKIEAEQKNVPMNFPSQWMMLSSLCDCFASSLNIPAIMQMPASINQMLCGGIVISACALSRIILKRKIESHHMLGCSFSVIGFVFIGQSSLINDSSISRYGIVSLVSGIVMVFVSLFAQGLQFIIQEYVFTHYQVDPYLMVGTEGLYGSQYTFVVIFIMSYISCPNQLLCDVTGYFEDPIQGFREIFYSTELMIWCVVILIIILFINLNGLVQTKYVSCVFNAFWNATRCISVWVVSVCIGLEKVELRSALIQMVGFILLVLGNLTYNEMIEWKCFGQNKNLQKYKKIKISKRQKPLTKSQLHENELNRNSFLKEIDSSESENVSTSRRNDVKSINKERELTSNKLNKKL